MKRKYIIRAAIPAALVILTVILGITVFSPLPDKGDETIITPTAAPELAALSTASPTPIPTFAPTEVTPTATNRTISTKPQIGATAAFTLKIKDRTISVAYGVDEATLDRTPGWIGTSASPGEDGMCVVYGHRNRTHLRVLEKVERGDMITTTMPDDTVYTYTVTDKQIYENTADLRLPIADGKTLALVTCYPFRYSGNAPGKCVVLAAME